jgi:hypothetical protein
VSNYLTRLSTRLAPVVASGRQEATQSSRPDAHAGVAIDVQATEPRSVASDAMASGSGPAPESTAITTPYFETTTASSAPRVPGVARDSPMRAPFETDVWRADDRAAQTPLPPAGPSASPTGTMPTEPSTPPTPRTARTVVEATLSPASQPAHVNDLPSPRAAFEFADPGTEPPGVPYPKAELPADQGVVAEPQALPRQDVLPARASTPAHSTEPATPSSMRQPVTATRAAAKPRPQRTEPRRQREPTTPRIDVHIGTITLSVRAPAPAPAPAPQPAPRPEPRPAFSASRHYLRCP